MGIGLILIIAGLINMLFSGMNAFTVSAVIIGCLLVAAELVVYKVFPAVSQKKIKYIRVMMIACTVIIIAITVGISSREYNTVKGMMIIERSFGLINEGNEGKAQELLIANSANLRYFPEFFLNIGTALVRQDKCNEYEQLSNYGGVAGECPYLPDYCYNTGLAFYKKGDYSSARAYFDRMLVQDPYNYEALLYKAICCIETETWREADYDLRLLRQCFPEIAEVHFWSAVFYYKVMDFHRSAGELDIVMNTSDCPILKEKAKDILGKIGSATESGNGGKASYD